MSAPNSWRFTFSEATMEQYPWFKYPFKQKWTPAELDEVTKHLNLDLKELKHYKKTLKNNSFPYNWYVIKSLYDMVEHKDGSSNNSDLGRFTTVFDLINPDGGKIRAYKLYGLYYNWSQNPVSKETFNQYFGDTYTAIPSNVIIIVAFLNRMKEKQNMINKRNHEKGILFKQICYGRQEKSKENLIWHF